jgi:hypothetical protein
MARAVDGPRGSPSARVPPALTGSAAHVLLMVASVVASVVGLASADAQSDDVPRPPRLDRAAEGARVPSARQPPATPAESRGDLLFELRPQDLADAQAQAPPSAIDTFVRPPNAARLAPLPEERLTPNGVEEIIVLGGNWRLPDLGSRWRARQEAADEAGTPHVTLLPLYDPERPTPFNNTFLLNREVERIGYIDLFRLRFGKRAKPDDE